MLADVPSIVFAPFVVSVVSPSIRIILSVMSTHHRLQKHAQAR
jgi:ABC-type phosphate transport system permease subunit